MAYVGQQPVVGRYILLDQISGGFNGTATGFTMTAGGQGVIPGLAQNVLLSLGGVIQQPGVDYLVSGSGLTFTTAPVSGTTFFATVLGDAQAVGTPSDGTVIPASIASSGTFVFPNVTVSGVTTIASGSAAAPSLSISGDANTGIYSPGTDQLAISTSGTGRLFADASGTVSIGTSANPTLGTFSRPSFYIKQLSDPANGFGAVHIEAFGEQSVLGIGYDGTAQAFTFDTSYRLTGAYRPITFKTSNVERLRITSAGLVGIATANPQVDLHIGNADGSSRSIVVHTANNGNARLRFREGSDVFSGYNEYSIGMVGNANAITIETQGIGEIVRFATDGKVGIGTSAPAQLLHVKSSSAYGVIVADNNGATGGGLFSSYQNGAQKAAFGVSGAIEGNTTSDLGLFADSTGGAIRFYTNGSPATKAILDSSGRLGIGTNSPSSLLEVSSATLSYIRSSSTTNLVSGVIGASTSAFDVGTTSSHAMNFYTAGVNRATLDTSGRLGIGTTSPQGPLHVEGLSGSDTARMVGRSGQSSVLAFYNNAATTNRFIIGQGYGSGSDNVGFVVNGANADLAFGTNNTERARIDSSGRLLVGTSTARIIEPYGLGTDGQVANTYESVSDTNPGPGLALCANSTIARMGPYLYFCRSSAGSVGSNTVVNSGDNLGTISFAGADGTDVRTRGAAIYCEVDGTPGSNDMPGRLVFSTTADGAATPTERMRITSDGVLMVSRTGSRSGITSACKLQVAGGSGSDWTADFNNTTGTAGNAYGIVISYTSVSPNGTGNEFLQCSDSTTARFTVRSNGGLANYSGNNVNLSDINTKKDISPAGNTWNCIKQWEIVNYRYKDQPDNSDLNLGVIAQQVAKSCPEVITVFQEATENEPEKLGIKEQQMYWMAIKALQEAQLRIEQLESSNANLLARVNALESS